jgi:hypothetical protein
VPFECWSHCSGSPVRDHLRTSQSRIEERQAASILAGADKESL